MLSGSGCFGGFAAPDKSEPKIRGLRSSRLPWRDDLPHPRDPARGPCDDPSSGFFTLLQRPGLRPGCDRLPQLSGHGGRGFGCCAAGPAMRAPPDSAGRDASRPISRRGGMTRRRDRFCCCRGEAGPAKRVWRRTPAAAARRRRCARRLSRCAASACVQQTAHGMAQGAAEPPDSAAPRRKIQLVPFRYRVGKIYSFCRFSVRRGLR